MPEYQTWQPIAGYFDGDGTIAISDLSNLPYRLSLSLIFVDQSFDQVKNVRAFLMRNGVATSNILRHYKMAAYIVAVSQFESVRKMLKEMSPFLCKKENEAKAALDYYEGRTTGNELVAVFKAEVEAGRRERRPHRIAIDVPFTLDEGRALMKEKRSAVFRDACGRFRSKVTPEDFERMRSMHFEDGRRLAEIARAYPQYARETIRRVLGGGRGYIGVKGIGRVDTTDTTLRGPKPA